MTHTTSGSCSFPWLASLSLQDYDPHAATLDVEVSQLPKQPLHLAP